jgi:hypothetical protein
MASGGQFMQKFLFSVLSVFIFMTFVSAKSNAEILIEPFVGQESSGSTEDNDKSTAIAYGARLGYSMLGLSFGVQYSMFDGDREEIDDAGVKKHDLTGSDLGLFVGYRFPMFIKVWATYFVASSVKIAKFAIDPDDSGPATTLTGDLELEGSGAELGIGFTFIPFVDLNIAYRSITYDDNKYTAASNADIEESDRDALVLSVSVPFTL